MLRRDTVTEVILPVNLVTGWQLDAGNVTISVIGIDGKCMLTTKRKNILNYFNILIPVFLFGYIKGISNPLYLYYLKVSTPSIFPLLTFIW